MNVLIEEMELVTGALPNHSVSIYFVLQTI